MIQRMQDMRVYANKQAGDKKWPSGKNCSVLADNRPKSALQKKQIQSLQDTPIQKKSNKTGLPDNLKSGIENLSGHSMDDVKVHYNSDKPAQLNAHAYAQGTDIHVASGQEKYLAHEAWHVVQQKQGRVKPTMQMKGKVNINDNKGLEKEADVMGAKAIHLLDNRSQIIGQRKMHENLRNGFQIDQFHKRSNNLISANQLPIQKKEDTIQKVQLGTIGTGLGVVAGLVGASVLTAGAGPLLAGAAYLGLGSAIGYAGRKIGQALDYSSLKSMSGLNSFQSKYGGSSQGTLALIHANDGNYYMIEQETNNKVKEAAEKIGIRYVKQGRKTGYHAEVRTIDWITENGIPLSGSVIWVSKPICPDCYKALSKEGVKVKTPYNQLEEERYKNWIPPSGESRAPVGEGNKYRGRRSEVERLLN